MHQAHRPADRGDHHAGAHASAPTPCRNMSTSTPEATGHASSAAPLPRGRHGPPTPRTPCASGQVLARWTKKIPDVAQAYVSGGTAEDQFSHPMDLAIDTQGNIYLSDGCEFCNGLYHVQKISPSGQPLARWALDGVGPGQVHDSRGVTVDAVGNGYLVDAGNGRVVKYAPNGPVLAQFGRRGKGPGELGYPFGIAVDVAGNVYVGDSENKRVQKFSPDGTPVTSFTPGGSFVALDNEGNVYTSDANLGLTKYSPSGQVLDRADGSTGNVALMLGK